MAAAFLINAGWRLGDEHWIVLPGKTAAMESFLANVRTVASNPTSLRMTCRSVIRNCIQMIADDRDLVPFVEQLPLPSQIQNYLNFDTECDALE